MFLCAGILCKAVESIVDFGHIHAFTGGGLETYEDFSRVVDAVEDALGFERIKNLHVHFSRVEYTKGGEKKHWTLEDTQYGPEFVHLAEVIINGGLAPTIICESRGTMARDARKMKEIYESVLKERRFCY